MEIMNAFFFWNIACGTWLNVFLNRGLADWNTPLKLWYRRKFFLPLKYLNALVTQFGNRSSSFWNSYACGTYWDIFWIGEPAVKPFRTTTPMELTPEEPGRKATGLQRGWVIIRSGFGALLLLLITPLEKDRQTPLSGTAFDINRD